MNVGHGAWEIHLLRPHGAYNKELKIYQGTAVVNLKPRLVSGPIMGNKLQ